MFTFAVLAAIAAMWGRAQVHLSDPPTFTQRRTRSGWAWAFIGASLGSFFGIAGFGSAIAGTLPGAALGYLLASHLLLKRQVGEPLVNPSAAAHLSNDVEIAAAALTRGVRPFMPRLIRLLKGFFLIAVTTIGVLWWVNARHAREAVSPQGAAAVAAPLTIQAASPTRTAADEQRDYDSEVARLEQTYPPLNPDSPLFEEGVVKVIRTRMQQLTSMHVPPDVALRTAVAEWRTRQESDQRQYEALRAKARSTHRAASPLPESALPECEYKAVMTDADYRACGVRPPGSQ